MRCPMCDVDLIDGGRPNVTSGYCPECQGEWFARGAVDRLLDRIAAAAELPESPEPGAPDGGTRPTPGASDARGSRGEASDPTAAGGTTTADLWCWF